MYSGFILIFGIGNRTSTCVWMDFLYLQRDLESGACPAYILVPRAHITRGQRSATRGSGQIHIKLASDWLQRMLLF